MNQTPSLLTKTIVRPLRSLFRHFGDRLHEGEAQLRLTHGFTRDFIDGPMPKILRINRRGLVTSLKKKAAVYPGMLLANSNTLEIGDVLSPVFGQLTNITDEFLEITAAEPSTEYSAPEFPDLLNPDLTGDELRKAIKALGISLAVQSGKLLVINCLNPEPGVLWAEPMLGIRADETRLGIAIIQKLNCAQNIVLVLPDDMDNPWPDLPSISVHPIYPNSLNALVWRTASGEESLSGNVISIRDVWMLGRTALEKKPFLKTVVTVSAPGFAENVLLDNGFIVSELLQHFNISANQGDTVLLHGGVMSAEALTETSCGIRKDSQSASVIPAGKFLPVDGTAPCINCGACVQVCPARLNPCDLSRDAEFSLFDRCGTNGIESCFQCGMCTYVCPARRPVLQYIQLAQYHIKEQERLAKLTPIKHA